MQLPFATILSVLAVTAAAVPVAESEVTSVQKAFIKGLVGLEEAIAAGKTKHAERSEDDSIEKRCDLGGYFDCIEDWCNGMFCPIGGCGISRAICIQVCMGQFGPGCP